MLKIKEQLIESLKSADVVKVKKHFNDLMEEFSATVIDQYRKHIASKFLVEGEEEVEDEEIEKTEIEEGINPKKNEPKDPKVGKKVTEEDEEIEPEEGEEEITESHKIAFEAYQLLLNEEEGDDDDEVANHVNDDSDPEKEDDKNKKKKATKKDGEE